MITAQEARRIILEKQDQKLSKERSNIEEAIRIAIDKGEWYITVPKIQEKTESYLRGLGYKIATGGRPMDEPETNISW